MPRFAILSHDHPFPHWDFLLENGDVCRTWRLLAAPDSTCEEISAEVQFDHRLMYLDYEGPVSHGRGFVSRWDAGTFEWLSNRSDVCEVQLDGRSWRGIVRLVRVGDKCWKCIRPV